MLTLRVSYFLTCMFVALSHRVPVTKFAARLFSTRSFGMTTTVTHSLGKSPSSGIDITIVPMFDDNYGYIIVDKATNQAAVVDPADSAPMFSVLQSLPDIELKQLWATHKHDDHVGGNVAFKKQYPSLEVIGTGYEHVPELTQPVKDGDVFTMGSLSIRVLHVPCHTTGHVAFYVEDEAKEARVVCTGDTLFVGGVGKFFEGTAEEMLVNMNRLSALPDDTVVCCAHEYTQSNLKFLQSIDPEICGAIYEEVVEKRKNGIFTVPTSIGKEKEYNCFIKCNDERIQQLTSKALGDSSIIGHPNLVMKALREMKNNFR
jgi:hydroxyacylglutathione hydrolase